MTFKRPYQFFFPDEAPVPLHKKQEEVEHFRAQRNGAPVAQHSVLGGEEPERTELVQVLLRTAHRAFRKSSDECPLRGMTSLAGARIFAAVEQTTFHMEEMMSVTISKRQSVILLAAVAVSTVWAGAALATPGSGAVGTVMARASFADRVDIKLKVGGEDAEVIQIREARETVMQQITIAAGGHTGWHSHPGPVVVLVKSGELTLYSSDDPSCTGRTYMAGEAFIDAGQGHVHIARNLSPTQSVELWVTYFDVPVGQPFRIDAPNPGTCDF